MDWNLVDFAFAKLFEIIPFVHLRFSTLLISVQIWHYPKSSFFFPPFFFIILTNEELAHYKFVKIRLLYNKII